MKNEEDLLSVAKKPKQRERSKVRAAGGLGGGVGPWQGLGSDIFEVYNCQKRNFLPRNAGYSREIDI